MEIIKICTFTFIALFIILLFRKKRDDIAVLISLVAGIILFLFIIPKISMILNFIQALSNKAGINYSYINIIFKVLGIAYISTFCAQICKDAGEGVIASKVEMTAKILILSLSIPILMAVLDSVLKIMQ